MVSRTCQQCGSRVAADEQFCPSCGAFIDPLVAESPPPSRSAAPRPRPTGNIISISSDGNNSSSDSGNGYEEFSLETPVEPPPVPTEPERITNGETIECPSCGAPNPGANRHCQQCGARLRQGPLPTAPRPAVQATAGVRAAVAISAILLAVILTALLFNFFGSEEAASSTTTPTPDTSSTQAAENAPIALFDIKCDPQGLGQYSCTNLKGGTGAGNEYQVRWEELEANEETVTIRLLFSEAMYVSRIEWWNISDDTRFRQNHRARGLKIDADRGTLLPFPWELVNVAGMQIIDYPAVNAHYIDIEIISTWPSEVTAGNTFPDLAIDEIVVWGRPYNTGNGG